MGSCFISNFHELTLASTTTVSLPADPDVVVNHLSTKGLSTRTNLEHLEIFAGNFTISHEDKVRDSEERFHMSKYCPEGKFMSVYKPLSSPLWNSRATIFEKHSNKTRGSKDLQIHSL
ncbi:hypothetical protein PM082_012166 [Marasmius tenuissimus]|nr:hypothetical protein PM082_012166 [Marasmius tenuissimus]